MANANAVWGIDVGQCALKAVRLELNADGVIEVTHFDLVEHPKILTQPDAEADQLIQNALDKFLSRNEIANARVAVSVPGQSSFVRFIKLPPVEPRRIPEIVKFEAVQQIPFDIEEVEWDYQTFISPKSPDVEVGIFAMRKEVVLRHLSALRAAGIEADLVQLAPLALYNTMMYDGMTAPEGATILIDVGAENTDLVISDGDRIWLRSIPLGGNNFTDSLVKAFKVPFSKAENLKRTAATNKYARQIFVAMRPVFGDLVSEVQRSIGFYTALHRDAHMTRVVCLGNAFRMPGLQKYLEQNLQVETVRPNAFSRLKPSSTVNAPAFQENLWSFPVAYGLGVQALGQAPISSNLLPFAIARQRHWRSQRAWFAAAAGVMAVSIGAVAVSACNTKSTFQAQNQGAAALAQPQLAEWERINREKGTLEHQGVRETEEIKEIKRVVAYRDTLGQLSALVQNAVPNDWRTIGEALVRKDNPKALRWRTDVWPKIGLPAYASALVDKSGQRAHIYLIEDLNIEFSPDKATVGAAAPAAAPVAGAPSPAPGPAIPPPPAIDPLTGAPLAAPRPAQPAAAQPGSRGYFVVRIVGYTDTPQSSIGGDMRTRFLDRMLKAKNDDSAKPKPADRLYRQIGLTEAVLIEGVDRDHLRISEALKDRPACWPPVAVAVAAAGGDAAATTAAQLPYHIYQFTLTLNVPVNAPDESATK